MCSKEDSLSPPEYSESAESVRCHAAPAKWYAGRSGEGEDKHAVVRCPYGNEMCAYSRSAGEASRKSGVACLRKLLRRDMLPGSTSDGWNAYGVAVT